MKQANKIRRTVDVYDCVFVGGRVGIGGSRSKIPSRRDPFPSRQFMGSRAPSSPQNYQTNTSHSPVISSYTAHDGDYEGCSTQIIMMKGLVLALVALACVVVINASEVSAGAPEPIAQNQLPEGIVGVDGVTSYGGGNRWVFTDDDTLYDCAYTEDRFNREGINCTDYSHVIPQNVLRSGFDTLQRGIGHVDNFLYILVADGADASKNASALVVLDIQKGFSAVFITFLPVRATWIATSRTSPAQGGVASAWAGKETGKNKDAWIYVGLDSKLVLTYEKDGKGIHPIGNGLVLSSKVKDVIGATVYDPRGGVSPRLVLLTSREASAGVPVFYEVHMVSGAGCMCVCVCVCVL
jgi:hypothetical protein